MLALLTTTGARPEAWAICETLMARQTYAGPVRWVVVDDGPDPQPITFRRDGWEIMIVRPQPFWKAPQNTQARNILAGLSYVEESDSVVIIEDDDYYAPAYLETAAQWLDKGHDLVGEMRSRYYNLVSKRGKHHNNRQHASLCSTAVQGRGIEALRAVASSHSVYIDLELWRHRGVSKALYDSNMVVGIKGLPGRPGIGVGHKPSCGVPANLEDWIGEDVRLYS